MAKITFFLVVRVRFQEPNYLFLEESGLATVCLVKDLETVTGIDVETVTSDNTANGKQFSLTDRSMTFTVLYACIAYLQMDPTMLVD